MAASDICTDSGASVVNGPLTPDSPYLHAASKRSCSHCHSRKIRCDKKVPCSACVRTQQTCWYAPLKKTRNRKKATMADVAARVAGLEQILNETRSRGSANTDMSTSEAGTHLAGHTSPTASVDTCSSKHKDGEHRSRIFGSTLARRGPSSLYFNEVLYSRFIKQESSLPMPLVRSTTASADARLRTSSHSLMGLLSHPSTFTEDTYDLMPSRIQAVRLWQTYTAVVDVSVKVLHVPTFEATLYSVISDYRSADIDDLALSLAVFFAAVVSLRSSDVVAKLGVDRPKALSNLRTAFERCLAKSDFLEYPSTKSLQALMIYLFVTRNLNGGRSIWVFEGLTSRMALSLGLHRDGSTFGLSVFESEMRRRLWWHVLSMEARAAEDYGISSHSFTGCYDTKAPRNLHDCDLWPEMTELPAERKGFTSMAYAVLKIESWRVTQKLAIVSPPTDDVQEWEKLRVEVVNGFKARMAPLLEACNPVIPLQRLLVRVYQALAYKIDFVTKIQWQVTQSLTDRDLSAMEENMEGAVANLESSLDLMTDEIVDDHRWLLNNYFQYHMIFFVLWHLCLQPESPLADRAWRVVDALFALAAEGAAETQQAPSSKLQTLDQLRTRAKMLQNSAKSGGIDHHRSSSNDALADAERDMIPGTAEWNDLQLDDMPDWNSLVRDLTLEFPF